MDMTLSTVGRDFFHITAMRGIAAKADGCMAPGLLAPRFVGETLGFDVVVLSPSSHQSAI